MKNFFGTENGKNVTLSTCYEESFWSKNALFGLFLGREAHYFQHYQRIQRNFLGEFDAIYNTQKFGDVTVTQKQILIACLECDCPKTIGALLIISNDDYPNREGRFLDSDFYRDNRENSPVQFVLSFLNSESAMLFLRECLENTKNSLLRIAFTHALMRASDVELKQFLEMRSTDAINNEFITVVKGGSGL